MARMSLRIVIDRAQHPGLLDNLGFSDFQSSCYRRAVTRLRVFYWSRALKLVLSQTECQAKCLLESNSWPTEPWKELALHRNSS